MDAADLALRNATYRLFVELGRAPSRAEVAAATGLDEEAVLAGWRRLHDVRAVVLDGAGDLRMANPFSAVPTSFTVDAAGRRWFGNCGWDAFGIGAALHVDCTIHTVCPDCSEPIDIYVRDGRPAASDAVFHILVPAASWWNDIGFT